MTTPLSVRSVWIRLLWLAASFTFLHGCQDDSAVGQVPVAPSVDRSPDTRRRTLTSDRGSQVTPSGARRVGGHGGGADHESCRESAVPAALAARMARLQVAFGSDGGGRRTLMTTFTAGRPER